MIVSKMLIFWLNRSFHLEWFYRDPEPIPGQSTPESGPKRDIEVTDIEVWSRL